MPVEHVENGRPEAFQPGQHIGLHLTVDRLLTTGPYRNYYLANNHSPRWYTRICWSCGHKHNPTTAESCEYCQTPLRKRSFILSSRWGKDVSSFHSLAAKRLRHVGLSSPIVLYQLGRELLAFYEMGDEAMLLDEPAPLHPRTLLSAAWTLAGGLHHLHRQGVALDGLTSQHILIHKERARLFDVDVSEVRPRPIAPGDPAARRDVCDLCRVLAHLTPLDQPDILEFFTDGTEDVFPGSLAFQNELRGFAREVDLRSTEIDRAAISVVGRVRERNEDCWAWRRLPMADIYIVADGMGGYNAGDVASNIAKQVVLDALSATLPSKPLDEDAMRAYLESIFVQANTAVRADSSDEGPTGTTLVLAIVWRDHTVHIAHIGDSRAYSFQKGKLHPLSEDHSMVAAMVSAGKLDREAARTHPRSNVLIQFLGNSSAPEPDLILHKGKPGEQILLCTDGLWGELPETVLEERLSNGKHARQQLRSTLTAVLDAGGRDNITAVLVSL